MEPPKCNLHDIDDKDASLAKFCLDEAFFASFRHDSARRFLYANRKACETLGYSLSELLNMSVMDIDPTVSADNWPELWKAMCDSGSITIETTHRRKDGTTFPVEVTANLLEYEDKRFAISFVQDITERKRTEEALRLTQFSFDRASIGIFMTGVDSRIINVNEQACRSLGYSREEMIKNRKR